MNFNQIISQVVDKVSTATGYSAEMISKALNKKRNSKKHDFIIYFHALFGDQLSENQMQSFHDNLVSANLNIINNIVFSKDLKMISFKLNKKVYFKDILNTIVRDGDIYGTNNIGNGKKAVIDFSSPNIAKLFHVGHFRTTVIGNFVKNLLNACGYQTYSINYLGDWGKQFGYVLLGYEKYGNETELKKDPLMHLFSLYVKISKEAKDDPHVDEQAREVFRKMEQEDDEKYMKKWKEFRELSISKYQQLYSKLKIEFDEYSGESLYNKPAREFAPNCELFKRDEDGSYVMSFGDEMSNVVVQKSDGTTLYLLRDIVAALDRIERLQADLLFYVVSSQQNLHFQQLFECLGRLGYDRNRFKHINYGMVQGMSTRNGNVHFLEDVLETAREKIKERIKQGKNKDLVDLEGTATNLAVTTLLISDFGANRIRDYLFDLDKRTSLEEGSGPSFQYVHCRLESIEEMNSDIENSGVGNTNIENSGVGNSDVENLGWLGSSRENQPDLSLVEEEYVVDLVYDLAWYPHIIELCHEDFEPSNIFVYLKDLCRKINSVIGKMRVKGAEKELARARLYVFKAARIVVANALRVLGVEPLRKM